MIEFTPYASGSAGNLYSVHDGETKVLIEAGLPIRRMREALGFGVSGLTGALISHAHGDHARSVKDLARLGIDCYMSAGTAEALGVSGHRIHVVKPLVQFQLGSWAVLPFDVRHDAPDPLGFLLVNRAGERLAFITDTSYVPYRFRNLSVIAVECNYDLPVLRENVESGRVARAVKGRVLRSHMSLETLCGFLSANDLSRVREIVLLHLSDDSSDAVRFKTEVQKLTGKPVRVAGSDLD